MELEIMEEVFDIVTTIYSLCDQASANKLQCDHLRQRVNMAMEAIEKMKINNTDSLEQQIIAEELVTILENAQSWVMKYSKAAWWRKILQAHRITEEYELISERLIDVSSTIILRLNAELPLRIDQQFDRKLLQQQNMEDMMRDLTDMNILIEDMNDEKVAAGSQAPKSNAKDDEMFHENFGEDQRDGLNSPAYGTQLSVEDKKEIWDENKKFNMRMRMLSQDMTEISGTDLTYEEKLLERERYCLYRGKYDGDPVAIKVYKGQSGKSEQSDEHIRVMFQNEKQSMKKLECLQILHLYGISIDNSGPETSYSLVMEVCSKGSLRDVLEKEPDLTWEQKIRMALDVARAIYRLHNTATILPSGTLSSLRFLVDESYCVKLLWISNIDSSIKKITHKEITKKSIDLDYLAPETPSDSGTYSKSSSLYSLGVLMFEIAAGKRPFQGLEVTEKNLVQMQEQLLKNLEDELPNSCPQVFKNLIRRLLHKNPNDRPSAGVVVDLLLSHLNKYDLEFSPVGDSD